jgi:hypothetical protein
MAQRQRQVVPRSWRQWLLLPVEVLFTLLAGSRPLPGSRGTFLVARRRYVGRPFRLPDGTPLRRGDLLAEIHFWNRRIAAREDRSTEQLTWRFVQDFRHDLGVLAAALEAGELGDVRAVYGQSPLAPAAARFGFHVRPLPRGLRRALLTLWQRGLRRAFRPAASRGEVTSHTAEIWMSTAELLRRYGPAPSGSRPAKDRGRQDGPLAAAGPRGQRPGLEA